MCPFTSRSCNCEMAAGYQAVTSDVHRIKHQTVPPHREITTTHLNDDATVKQATLASLRLVYLGGGEVGVLPTGSPRSKGIPANAKLPSSSSIKPVSSSERRQLACTHAAARHRRNNGVALAPGRVSRFLTADQHNRLHSTQCRSRHGSRRKIQDRRQLD